MNHTSIDIIIKNNKFLIGFNPKTFLKLKKPDLFIGTKIWMWSYFLIWKFYLDI